MKARITVGAVILICAGLAGPTSAQAHKTYGLQYGSDLGTKAVYKPDKYSAKTPFEQITVKNIDSWAGWGQGNVSSNADQIKECDANGNNCVTSPGTITFKNQVLRLCRVKPDKPKKYVLLYGLVEIDSIASEGIGFGFGDKADPPDCPKF